MKILYKLAVSLICTAALPLLSYAGGQPVKKGKYIMSLSASYFKATQLWDASGKVGRYGNGGYFSSKSLSFYGEYGISRRLTGVVSLPFVINEYREAGIPAINSQGLTDVEVGLRYYLANVDFKYYFALQGTAIAPLYSNKGLGYSSPGTEVKLIGSGSGKLGSKNLYYSADIGARQYFQDAGPFQLRYSAAAGLNLDSHNLVTIGGSGVYSTSINKSFDENLALNKNYSLLQGSFTYTHVVNKNLSFGGTVSQALTGRSTGKGTIFSFAVLTNF